MVVRAVAPHITVEALEPLTKFVPVTVRVKGAAPAAAAETLSVASVGPLTVKVLPKEAGVAVPFATVTLVPPPAASWALVTAAVICVALT